ncbi:hypothetical protein HF521_018006 [Silurus meridionalis]|uniref:Uncharacterized protein n=1 Tax=Silurus meridionalis TaxID=175797 RepID=A0A8T0BPB8_SILME|nr:hypothetical protein HF521_018006 [Silurus meridionalis]
MLQRVTGVVYLLQHPFSIKAPWSSRAQHHTSSLSRRLKTRQNLSTDSTVSLKMIWIRVLIVSSLLALLHAHKHCTQLVKWGNLLQTLSSMSSGISETCAHHYNKDRLCDPSHMLHQVELNAMLLSDVMKEAESIYYKNPNPEHFIHQLQRTQRTLTQCTFDHKPVTTCFKKLQTFIQDNMSHESCAWEIVNVTVREILQRLEKRMLRKRR